MRRLLAIFLLAVLGLAAGAAATVYGLTERRIRRIYEIPVPAPAIPVDGAALARGRHLAVALASCTHCHGEDLGGRDYIDGGPLGHLYTPNLTRGRGGIGGSLGAVDWVRAIRHGVGRDGRSLWFMPAESYELLSDEDLAALIAYLQSLPPVDRELPASRIGVLGRARYVAGRFPFLTAERLDHARPRVARVRRDTSAEYGYYLARLGACIGCHGPALAGGPVPAAPPGTPPAANLTRGGLAHYDEADFRRALREGRRPDGTAIDTFMPLVATRHWTDEEIRAVWSYLRSLPARPFGAR